MRPRSAVLALLLLAASGLTACGDDPRPDAEAPERRVVGYYTAWGGYGRDYSVKDVPAARLTHLLYAFGKVSEGKCAIDDAWAAHRRPIGAADSVDGVADKPTGSASPAPSASPLQGNFGQLRKLKQAHPKLKVLWSFGGWTGSAGFAEAARDPERFAKSCHALLNDPRWAGLFDGIDIDWEYPNACGKTCDTSGRDVLDRLLGALRATFGPAALVTAAVPADVSKLQATDYPAASRHVDWLAAMTYDYFGTGSSKQTAPHSPLSAYPGIPRATGAVEATVDELLRSGIPAQKILLGIGFYGRGWTGVTGDEPGAAAAGPAAGKFEKGLEDYKVLATRCPPTGAVGGTAYARCGTEWWSYDTPETVRAKMAYARSKSLGGAFAWELSGDTPDAALLTAMTE